MDALEVNINGLDLKAFKEPRKSPFKDTFVEDWPILRTD
jgi:hypothetical protein